MATCFAIAVTLASLPLIRVEDFNFPTSTLINISDVSIDEVKDGAVFLNYTAAQSELIFFSPTKVRATAKFESFAGPGSFVFNVVVSSGMVAVDTPVKTGTCNPKSVSVSSCSVRADITGSLDMQNPIDGYFFNQFLNDTLVALDKILNNASTCVGVARLVSNFAVESPAVNPTLPPAPEYPGRCDLQRNALLQAASTIFDHLPTIFGVRLGLMLPSPNVVRVSVAVDQLTVDPLVVLGDSFFIPPGTDLSMDVVFGAVTCAVSNGVSILGDNVSVTNVRILGAREDMIVKLFDDLEVPLGKVLTDVLRALAGNASSNDTAISIVIPVQPGPTAAIYIMAMVASACSLIGIAAVFISYRRHSANKHVLLDEYGNQVSLRRLLASDIFITVVCCGLMCMFAWSNQTGAARVFLGGTLELYNFGLASSVDDMWKSGMYPLSIFIAFFCGFYPYFKLLAIILFAVVLQKPQSKVIRFVDMCGKFSFLDSFVMIITAEGLTVPGVMAVEMGASFWVFLAATCASILIGNFATHGWRADLVTSRGDLSVGGLQVEATTVISSSLLVGDRTPRTVSYRGAYVEDMTPGSPHVSRTLFAAEAKDIGPASHAFRPIIAGVFVVLIVGCLGTTALFETIEFNNSGLGAWVTGKHITFTVMRLIRRAPVPLFVVAVVTMFAMPVLFAAGYSKTRILAAWCAPDVFVLACVAALLQLDRFVSFVLSGPLHGAIQISAKLLWPIYAMGGAVALLWILIIGVIFF